MKSARDAVKEVMDLLPQETKDELKIDLEQTIERLEKLNQICGDFAEKLADFLMEIEIINTDPTSGIKFINEILSNTTTKVFLTLKEKMQAERAIREAVNKDPKLTGN